MLSYEVILFSLFIIFVLQFLSYMVDNEFYMRYFLLNVPSLVPNLQK